MQRRHCRYSTTKNLLKISHLSPSSSSLTNNLLHRCGPCKYIAPKYEALARQYKDKDIVFLKVDVDKVPKIKSILSVWAMPSFYFIRNGTKISSFMGANESLLQRGLENDGNIGMCSSCSIL